MASIVMQGALLYRSFLMPPFSLRMLVTLLVPVAALTLSAGYWWNQSHAQEKLRATARQAAEYRVIQLSSAVGQQTEILFQTVDITLQNLAHEYAAEEFPDFLRTVSYAQSSFPEVAEVQVSINDRKGNIVYSSVGRINKISVADREYFQFHRRTKTAQLFVGEPLLARTTRSWSIPFSRPIYGKNGFAGVVTIGISPAYLSQRWKELKLLPRDVVSVVRRDGRYLARSLLLLQAMTARDTAAAGFFAKPAVHQGLQEGVSEFDGIHRLNGWQRLGNGNMAAVVGLDIDAVALPIENYIQQSRLRNITVNIVFLLACVLITWLMVRWQRHRAMLQAIYDVLPVGIVVADGQGRIVDCNHMSEQLLGLDRQVQLSSLIGNHDGNFVRSDGSLMPSCELPSMRALHDQQIVHHEEVGFVHPNGQDRRWFSVSAIPGADSGYGVIIAFIDITHARDHREAVEHIAFHDALTGLPNRRLLSDRLSQSLSRAERQSGRLAVCFLDLDGFKPVNDRHGHEAGDMLLVEIARRLLTVVRADDTVSRLGGDEFVVVLNGLSSEQERDEILVRITATIAVPIYLAPGSEAHVTASIGVAMYPQDGNDADTLLRRADQAMYRAKQSGKNVCHFRSEIVDNPVK